MSLIATVITFGLGFRVVLRTVDFMFLLSALVCSVWNSAEQLRSSVLRPINQPERPSSRGASPYCCNIVNTALLEGSSMGGLVPQAEQIVLIPVTY